METYQDKEISSAQVSDKNKRDSDCEAKADSNPEEVCPAKS